MSGDDVKRIPARTLRRMPQTEPLLECANCSRPVRERDAESLGWRYWSDDVDLHLICALCAHREFRLEAPESTAPLPQ